MRDYAERTELTENVKAYARSFSPWENIRADMVVVITAESLDAVPSYWVWWQINDHTKRTGEYLEGAVSVIVLGYPVWDDVCEMISLKGDRFEAYACMGMEVNARKLVRWLRRRGHSARIAGDLLPKKQMAQLVGFGGYARAWTWRPTWTSKDTTTTSRETSAGETPPSQPQNTSSNGRASAISRMRSSPPSSSPGIAQRY